MESWFYTIPATQASGKKEITVQKVCFYLCNTEVRNISLLAEDITCRSKDSHVFCKLLQLLIFVKFVKLAAVYLSFMLSRIV